MKKRQRVDEKIANWYFAKNGQKVIKIVTR
jgi:hypothetical protein